MNLLVEDLKTNIIFDELLFCFVLFPYNIIHKTILYRMDGKKMERTEFLKMGAFCVKRMSLKAQRELLSLARNNSPFTDIILSELRDIENGNRFISACNGRLDKPGFMDILTYCDQPTIDRIITTEENKTLFLSSQEINGYFVLENGAIYYTSDMDATLHWFKQILGWEGNIESRDDAGNGTYGLIEPHMKANSLGNRSPYLQLMRGDPGKSVSAFVKVWGLSGLRQRIIANGWKKLTPIVKQAWGADLFDMTTCDGSIIRFYEPSVIGY
jgi:hypothetical protein